MVLLGPGNGPFLEAVDASHFRPQRALLLSEAAPDTEKRIRTRGVVRAVLAANAKSIASCGTGRSGRKFRE